jgi:hypothetical protein
VYLDGLALEQQALDDVRALRMAEEEALGRVAAGGLQVPSCSVLSTPSAVTDSPSAWPSTITALTIATPSDECGIPRTNERSMFTQSTGKVRRYSSDE